MNISSFRIHKQNTTKCCHKNVSGDINLLVSINVLYKIFSFNENIIRFQLFYLWQGIDGRDTELPQIKWCKFFKNIIYYHYFYLSVISIKNKRYETVYDLRKINKVDFLKNFIIELLITKNTIATISRKLLGIPNNLTHENLFNFTLKYIISKSMLIYCIGWYLPHNLPI